MTVYVAANDAAAALAAANAAQADATQALTDSAANTTAITDIQDTTFENKVSVTQADHGFTVGITYVGHVDVTSGTIVGSTDDSATSGGSEFLFTATDANTLEVYGQFLEIPAHGYTLGQTYFVDATAGGATTTEPTAAGTFVQPSFVAFDADRVIMLNQLANAN